MRASVAGCYFLRAGDRSREDAGFSKRVTGACALVDRGRDHGKNRGCVGIRMLWGRGQCVEIRIRRMWDLVARKQVCMSPSAWFVEWRMDFRDHYESALEGKR